MARPVNSFKFNLNAKSDWTDVPTWTEMSVPVPLQLDPGFLAMLPPAAARFAAHQAPPVARAPVAGTEEVISFDMTETIDGGGLNALRSAPAGGVVTAGTGTNARLMTTYTSGAIGKYNVTVNFEGVTSQSTGGWTPALQGTFVGAAERISKLIVGDVPPVVMNGRKIDDIQITASLADIDGSGGILGQAGVTSIRATSKLPSTGLMRFDTADAQRYLGMGLFDEIVTHEMMHCVGYGTLWKINGLIAGSNFIGQHAVDAFNDLVDEYAATHGGSMTLGNGTVLFKDLVPLETSGGSGTAGSHWSENVFNTEMMTGYLDTAAVNGSVVAPLSAMTMASLRDLGYMTGDVGATDAFRLV